jgi:predicted amidophosphoribosyltransferase
MHTCGGCRRILPRTGEYFHANVRRKDGLQGWCKDCLRPINQRNGEARRDREREQRSFAIASFAHMAKVIG